MTIPIKILIADDHPIVRDGFQKLLELTDGFEVIGTAENGKQTFRLVLLHHPDVILLDVYMPEMNGLETIQDIRALHSEARILLITSHPDDELVIQALLNGAHGFLLKEWETERIVSAIQNSLKGQMVWPDVMSQSLITRLKNHQERHGNSVVNAVQQNIQTPNEEPDLSLIPWDRIPATVSKQDKKIITLIWQGCTNVEIARRLY